MIIKVKDTWGYLLYDTETHFFNCELREYIGELPYTTHPLVLNCYLTHKCNMFCKHCVAKDMSAYNKSDLNVGPDLVRRINDSPFFAVVLSGGEPLLPEKEEDLLFLIHHLKEKGIIIDTNGTIVPSEKLLSACRDKDVLFRVSLDSTRPEEEVSLRGSRKKKDSKKAYFLKLLNIQKLLKSNSPVTIQTVLHKTNSASMEFLLHQIKDWGIASWYIQRLIPTKNLPKAKGRKKEKFYLENDVYEDRLNKIQFLSEKVGLSCITKKDRRHNCVFIMVGDGDIFTSSDRDGERIFLGKIGEIRNYFEYVSASEHSSRYYSIGR